jgi:hypothetical protein
MSSQENNIFPGPVIDASIENAQAQTVGQMPPPGMFRPHEAETWGAGAARAADRRRNGDASLHDYPVLSSPTPVAESDQFQPDYGSPYNNSIGSSARRPSLPEATAFAELEEARYLAKAGHETETIMSMERQFSEGSIATRGIRFVARGISSVRGRLRRR